MFKRCCAALLALVLAVSFSSLIFAQDAAKKEMKGDMKKEMSKDTKKEEKMGPMKSLSCDPSCGFMVRSHDEKEIMSAAMAHIKKHHAEMKMSEKDVKAMMKTEDEPAMKK
jgi:predicted small metal-binding protein